MNDQSQQYLIPRTLDDPNLLLFFQADTASCFLVVFLLSVSINFIFAALLAFVVTKSYVQLKENGDRGLILQLLYWYSPSEMWLSRYLPSHVREYSGR